MTYTSTRNGALHCGFVFRSSRTFSVAWQDEPGKPIGQAITARILNPDAEEAKAFIGWRERVFTIWERTKAQHSTQMIFCDLSTPRAEGFDVYNDIRDKLVARGIPKEERCV